MMYYASSGAVAVECMVREETRTARRYVNRCLNNGGGLYDILQWLPVYRLFEFVVWGDEITAYIAASLIWEDPKQLTTEQAEQFALACNERYLDSSILNTLKDRFPMFWFRLKEQAGRYCDTLIANEDYGEHDTDEIFDDWKDRKAEVL